MTPLVERVDARALRRLERRRVDDVLSARSTPWMLGQDERPTPWAQGGSWLPWQAIAGCKVALLSHLGITLNGSKVSAWADQSGNANNATQSTGTSQPSYNASDAGYGGRPTVQFAAASSQFMKLAALLPAQPFTAYVVGESTSDSGAQQEFFGDSTANCCVYMSAGTTPWRMYAGANVTSSNGTRGSALVFGAVFNGASSALYIAASSSPTTGNAGTGNPGGTAEGIGAQGTGSSCLNGKMAMFLAFSGAHTSAQVASVFRWASGFYGKAWS